MTSNSNYERAVKIWYLGTAGPACLIGPGSGCLNTKAKNIVSYRLEEYCIGKITRGILELRKQYLIPQFAWDRDGKIYPNLHEVRTETYTRIQIPTELVE